MEWRTAVRDDDKYIRCLEAWRNEQSNYTAGKTNIAERKLHNGVRKQHTIQKESGKSTMSKHHLCQSGELVR